MKTEILSYDWHGINRNGERLITFAKRPLQDGGGYILAVPERDRYGFLFAAAPALLAAAKFALQVQEGNGTDADEDAVALREAIELAEGKR